MGNKIELRDHKYLYSTLKGEGVYTKGAWVSEINFFLRLRDLKRIHFSATYSPVTFLKKLDEVTLEVILYRNGMPDEASPLSKSA